MERTKRAAASKVTNYRTYHLSGDLNTALQGRVGKVVGHFEDNMAATLEEMKQQLEEERERSRKMQEEAEMQEIRSELEAEKQKQAEWQLAMQQLEITKTQREADHRAALEKIKCMVQEAGEITTRSSVEWFQQQMGKLNTPQTEEDKRKQQEQEEKNKAIQALRQQQEEIKRQLS